jgi:hypothetical protein
MNVLIRLVQALAWVVLGGLLIQIYLAGAALFGVTTFQPHRALGEALAGAMLLLLVVALIARPGRRVIGMVVALTVLTIVQISLPSLRGDVPWVAALHAVNAVVLVGLTINIARASSQATDAIDSREARPLSAETS